MALNGQTDCVRVCLLLDQSRQRSISIGGSLSAFDPTATLAVHRGNGFDAGFSPIKLSI
jgi:hypothetical protein